MSTDFSIKATDFDDVYIIIGFDNRTPCGGVYKPYSKAVYADFGIDFSPVESLVVYNNKNVLRGLHFQRNYPTAKLITVMKGSLYAVVVNIDKNSPNIGKWISMELSGGISLYVGKKSAIGVYTHTDAVHILQNDERFYPEYDDGIRYDDKDLDITWPFSGTEKKPIISDKDNGLMSFKQYMEMT